MQNEGVNPPREVIPEGKTDLGKGERTTPDVPQPKTV
jgi:hypothetical protein